MGLAPGLCVGLGVPLGEGAALAVVVLDGATSGEGEGAMEGRGAEDARRSIRRTGTAAVVFKPTTPTTVIARENVVPLPTGYVFTYPVGSAGMPVTAAAPPTCRVTAPCTRGKTPSRVREAVHHADGSVQGAQPSVIS